jgi:hypothetical protein
MRNRTHSTGARDVARPGWPCHTDVGPGLAPLALSAAEGAPANPTVSPTSAERTEAECERTKPESYSSQSASENMSLPEPGIRPTPRRTHGGEVCRVVDELGEANEAGIFQKTRGLQKCVVAGAKPKWQRWADSVRKALPRPCSLPQPRNATTPDYPTLLRW